MSEDDEYEPRRFRLVGVLRGPLAREIAREYRTHPERFALIVAAFPFNGRGGFTHLRRVDTPLHYRFTHRDRTPVAMELVAVERLWWPDGAQIDQRNADERRYQRSRR